MKKVYAHIEVDAEFVPKSLRSRVNVARTPKFVLIDKVMHKIAEGMRKIGLDKIVWFVKKSGATDKIRGLNTYNRDPDAIDEKTFNELQEYFKQDTKYLSNLLQRNLVGEWGIEKFEETDKNETQNQK